MQKVHNFAEKGRQSTLQGSGQPLPAQCCRSEQADDKTACSPDLSLRGGAADVAISGRQLRFRRECLVIRPYSARFPRRDAPRNDKLGSLAPMNLCRDHCRPAWRSLSAATDAIGFYVFIGGLYESTVQRREGHVPPLQRPAGGRAEKFPGACAPGNGSFQSRTFVSISARHFVRKSSTLMAPRSTPARVRTDTVWFSMSRSPTTSIYGIFCIWASRIL